MENEYGSHGCEHFMKTVGIPKEISPDFWLPVIRKLTYTCKTYQQIQLSIQKNSSAHRDTVVVFKLVFSGHPCCFP